MDRPRGAKPSPRHKLAASSPHRIRGATPAQFVTIPKQLSYWLNNVDGDCVTAEEAFAKAAASVMAGAPEIFIQDATVQTWASAHGVLNGADLSQVLDAMAVAGFSQDGVLYNDGQATSVDWTNPAVLQNAISQGPVKIGVAATQLDNVVGTKNGWFATGFMKDTALDHCVSLCGYGPADWLMQQLGGISNTSAPAYALFTWDTIGVIDAPSMVAITGEAWLRTPTTIINGVPTPVPTPAPIPVPSPSGLSLAQVLAVVNGEFSIIEKAYPFDPFLRVANSLVDRALQQNWPS